MENACAIFNNSPTLLPLVADGWLRKKDGRCSDICHLEDKLKNIHMTSALCAQIISLRLSIIDEIISASPFIAVTLILIQIKYNDRTSAVIFFGI